ncbi:MULTISPECIES: hypothetical protein [unclassified Mesorhizobium]|nr:MULTISPECIES: hypothetical protein [unclassified Mesorhizobium]
MDSDEFRDWSRRAADWGADYRAADVDAAFDVVIEIARRSS